MKINNCVSALFLITFLLFFITQIRSVSLSKYSVETIDDESFLSEQPKKIRVKNVIKNKINFNNGNKKDVLVGYRDL